ncbi:MAG: LacI family DNA-binding transcriptional regulator, partial [Propionibacteriales bacterium]|nr:LacI family DNA-binding transcriptional regulator [Propionibacteriales bacterium]
MARPTIYSVADEAGVSISTVSLVFNRPHKVRAATRDNVVAAAHRLGYRPPARAESSRGQLATVAVAAPFSTVPSCSLR